MKTNIIVTVFIISLIVFGVFVYLNAPPLYDKFNNNPNVGVKSDNVVVYLKGSRFVPDIITIKVGTSVTLINKDKYAHTLIARGSLKYNVLNPEESYTYTFNEQGEFGFYAKLNPAFTGKVIVVN